MERRLPRFLCVGAHRSGTTWLDHMLRQHPDVFLPAEKETMFFSHHYHRGLEWYASHFRKVRSGQLPGEICPMYLQQAAVAGRIRESIPDVGILMVLREPVAQIRSMYGLWVRRGRTRQGPDEAVRRHPELLRGVLYGQHLERYRALFDAERVRVFFYDDLVADPVAFLRAIQDALGLEPFLPEDWRRPVNASTTPRSRWVERWIARGGTLLRRRGWISVKTGLGSLPLVSGIRRMNRRGGDTLPALGPETIALIRERTDPEIRRVEELTGRDLSTWRDRRAPPGCRG